MAGGARVPESGFDVFASYAHADVEWARRLAENLSEEGLRVFFDEWGIGPGDVVVHEIDSALLTTSNGVVVVSPASMESPWVAEEYAAMMHRAIGGKLRVIPVLYGDAEMPPLLAAHRWIDFRRLDGPDYECQVRRLVAALRGERPGPPPRGGGLRPPPGSVFRAEGPMGRTLRVTADEVTLLDGGREVASHRPRGRDHGDEQRLWEMERLRGQWPEDSLTRADAERRKSMDAQLQRALLEAGAALGRSALDGAAGAALRQAVAEAERLNVALELGLEIAGNAMADLPWEAVRLPAPGGEFGPPLALHPRVRVYRSLPGAGTTTAVQVRAPLRVLVAIGSPESDDERGELLDYEAEMAAILDVVERARSGGGAYVRVLERGTVAALNQALRSERYHVLHVSCHAGPGRLVLEDERGGADLVDAGRFMSEVLPAGRGVPLVVLAGCMTALSVREREERAAALPGLARALVGQGVPAVLAMSAAVGDAYATRLMAEVYRRLGEAERPDPLEALSDARRQIEVERGRRGGPPRASRPEWATPVLYRRGPGLPLYDRADGIHTVRETPEPALAPGVVVRQVGEFVGRRRDRRLLLRALRGERAGVVVHGLGGAGKSTLAAELVKALGEETALVASVAGAVGVDQVLDEVGRRLLAHCVERDLDERHPHRELSRMLRAPDVEWRDRMSLLGQLLLSRERLLLVLDDFEDNLTAEDGSWRVADDGLASLLASWAERPGRSRLIVTSRHPFRLPEGREGRLERHHLGPLSPAETRKLMWRLPGLDALGAREKGRAHADVGGHPRALEYLDALLRKGRARFEDVAERMERALRARGVERPRAWMAAAGGGMDSALAEAVTLAVDDVLLEGLVGRLEGVEGGWRLLLGASVYRPPVEEIGLWWQAGDQTGDEVSEAFGARREDVRPPLHLPGWFRAALAALEGLGLVALVAPAEDGGSPRYTVHRWTAAALAGMAGAGELAAAHRRAGRHWQWRARAWARAQGWQQAVLDLVEARHHLHAAGDVEEALVVTYAVVTQLDTWGAWGWRERICLETLGWVPEGSRPAADIMHELGLVAQQRGDYDAALGWYGRALAIAEESGDAAGMAVAYQQLGIVAQLRGDYDVALRWYRRSLAIKEELRDRAGMAASYHQLGTVAEHRGDHHAALEWYGRSLAIRAELQDQEGMAAGCHQMGTVAEQQGDYDAALVWHGRALTIREAIGDRKGVADSYHQLGVVAQLRDDYDAALGWYRRSLAIAEELDDRALVARSYHQMGMVAYLRGDHGVAEGWYRRSLAIKKEIGDRPGMASTAAVMGALLTETGRAADAVPYTLTAVTLSLEMRLPQAPADIRWLAMLRAQLGEGRFWGIVGAHVDQEHVAGVRRALDVRAGPPAPDV